MRTLFYPRSRLTLAAAQSSVAEINAEVIKLAKERKQTVFPVQNRWYGFDPVHVLRRYHRQMWSEILLRWRPDQPLSEFGRSSLAESLYLVTLPPRERKFFGFSRWRVQPSGVLSDGSTISLYWTTVTAFCSRGDLVWLLPDNKFVRSQASFFSQGQLFCKKRVAEFLGTCTNTDKWDRKVMSFTVVSRTIR